MPRASNIKESEQFVKLLLIGDSKAGKDHFTCEAAEAGFNLVYLDGDVASQTIGRVKPGGDKFFSEAARNRIYHVPCGDGVNDTRFAPFMKKLIKARPSAYWDDTKGEVIESIKVGDYSESAIWEIALTKLGANDVLVISTWTALAQSIMKYTADRTGESLDEMEKADQSIYASCGNFLTQVATAIQRVRCHVIVQAHPDEHLEYRKPIGKANPKQKELILTGQMMIPKSSSKPHGRSLGKFFTDVLWISPSADGSRYIDGRPNPNKIIGSRFDQRKKSDEYSFAELVRQAGGVIPESTGSTPGIVEHPMGAFTRTESAGAAVLDGSNKMPVKGINSILGKK